ncbi:unnamed protein product [Calypogeia fissa]
MDDDETKEFCTGEGAHHNGTTTMRMVVRTLDSGKSKQEGVVEDIFRLERRIFPKHESLADNLDKELQKRNVGVLYSLEDDYYHNDNDDDNADDSENYRHPGEKLKKSVDHKARAVAGYVMYSYTSLAASITKLAVRESFRRQGYGEALVKAAIEKARAKRVLCVNLHVDPLRTPALTLYKKLGFEVDTLVHSYYAPGRDAYRMVLTLASD